MVSSHTDSFGFIFPGFEISIFAISASTSVQRRWMELCLWSSQSWKMTHNSTTARPSRNRVSVTASFSGYTTGHTANSSLRDYQQKVVLMKIVHSRNLTGEYFKWNQNYLHATVDTARGKWGITIISLFNQWIILSAKCQKIAKNACYSLLKFMSWPTVQKCSNKNSWK